MSSGSELTPKIIHDELTAFINERSKPFRQRTEDTAIIRHETRKYYATVEIDDENDSEPYDIYNTKSLELTAAYDVTGTERAIGASIVFNLSLESTTRLNRFPPLLQTQFSNDTLASYPAGESYNLSEHRQLLYTVRNFRDSQDIRLMRKIGYQLRDDGITIYQTAYPSPKNNFERVAVAQEQRTIVVPPRIAQEQNSSVGDQVEYDASLYGMRAASSSPETTRCEFEHDSILSVRALLRVLQSSAALPTTVDRLY